jgi:hypothetical protein
VKSPAFLAAALLLAVPALAQSLPVDVYRKHVETLAQPAWRGRGSGERGNEAAARYIAEHFKRAGLKPLTKGYLQPFTFAYGLSSGRNNRLTLSGHGESRRYRAGRDFTPWALSASKSVSGELQAGLESGEARGKVVLLEAEKTDARSLAGPVAKAREAGAVGVLVSVPSPDLADALSDTDPASADVGIPVLLVPRLLAGTWRGAPAGVKVALSAEVRHETRRTANIVGVREGTDPALKSEFVVIGAHMDHLGMGGISSLDASRKPAIHHGADDNASGTAALLGIAQSLPPTKRSVLFIAFSGEERGLLGSKHYVEHPLVPLEKTVAMFNLDMVGRLRQNKLSALGVGTGDAWPTLLDDANKTALFSLSRDEGSFGGSDHQSFAAKKIPVLFFFTGLHEDYHKPTDTPEKIDPEGIARIAALTGNLAGRVADANMRIAFQEVASAPGPGRMRARASLGTVPEYGQGIVGVLLGGVRPGSPAEKAGLKAGDILIRFAGKTVRNIEEYTALLGEAQPGQLVELVVLREGKEVTLSATLAESRR